MKRRIIVVALVLALCLCLTGCKSSDYKKAVGLQEAGDYASAAEIFQALGDYQDSSARLGTCNDYLTAIQLFNEAVTGLGEKNTVLDSAVEAANAVAYSESKALDETLRPALETAISEAKAARVEAPELPTDLAAITSSTEDMSAVDYTSVMTNLAEKQDALELSMKQYALVDNPDESYVITCLGRVSGVIDIAAATEDNDPNGQLHKAGGYTAAVYFSHENVDQSRVYGVSLIDKGTDAGGQVEVYATPEDAVKRDTYLAAFDGSAFSSGSHVVIGTCVVRTSNELKASQQNELTANIIAELTRID